MHESLYAVNASSLTCIVQKGVIVRSGWGCRAVGYGFSYLVLSMSNEERPRHAWKESFHSSHLDEIELSRRSACTTRKMPKQPSWKVKKNVLISSFVRAVSHLLILLLQHLMWLVSLRVFLLLNCVCTFLVVCFYSEYDFIINRYQYAMR